jgi:hypothetical protein
MIVEISIEPKANRYARRFVIDWDKCPPPWCELGKDIALSLDTLARRGAGWRSVTVAEKELAE